MMPLPKRRRLLANRVPQRTPVPARAHSWLESLAKLVTVIGGVIAAVIALRTYDRSVDQSARELEWKRAEQARSIVDAMLKDEGWQAMTMLDWREGRLYEISPKKRVRIQPTDVP